MTTHHHLQFAHRTLKYLKNTKFLKLHFNGQSGFDFHFMVNSPYVSHIDCKSQYGISVYLNSFSRSCITISNNRNLWHYHLQKRNILPSLKHQNLLCGFVSFLLNRAFHLLNQSHCMVGGGHKFSWVPAWHHLGPRSMKHWWHDGC